MSVATVMEAMALFEAKYGLDPEKESFYMEHDQLWLPGPTVEETSEEDKVYLESLYIVPDDNEEGWMSFG